LECNRRFTTYERVEFIPITVLKRDGERESFDRSKLLRGVIRACEKTGVLSHQLEVLVDEIEAELQQLTVRDIPSHEIGELVLRHLQALNEVAYVRFASVYRQFQGIQDFAEALNHLQSCTDRPKVNQEEFQSNAISGQIPLNAGELDLDELNLDEQESAPTPLAIGS